MIFKLSGFFFFYFGIIGIYTIYLPQILQNYGYDSIQIGISFAVAPLVRLLMPFVFLKYIKLDDKIFYIALFLSFISSLGFYFFVENFYLFLFANILYGIGFGIVLPYIENYALEFLGKEKYGKIRLFGSLGFIVVSIIFPYFSYNSENAFYIMLILNIFMIIFSIYTLHKYRRIKNINEFIRGKMDFKSNLGFWINIFLVQLSLGAFYNFFTIYCLDNGISLKYISYLWVFGVICEILFFYIQASILRKQQPLALLQIATLATAFRWFLLYIFPSNLYILFFSQSIHALSFALFHTVAFSYLLEQYRSKAALASQFYYGVAFGGGALSGSFIAGLVYGKYLFLFAGIVVLLAFCILKSDIINKKTKDNI